MKKIIKFKKTTQKKSSLVTEFHFDLHCFCFSFKAIVVQSDPYDRARCVQGPGGRGKASPEQQSNSLFAGHALQQHDEFKEAVSTLEKKCLA